MSSSVLQYAPTILLLLVSIITVKTKKQRRTENYLYCHRVNRVRVRVRLMHEKWTPMTKEGGNLVKNSRNF
jgi:hypothetical protein